MPINTSPIIIAPPAPPHRHPASPGPFESIVVHPGGDAPQHVGYVERDCEAAVLARRDPDTTQTAAAPGATLTLDEGAG